MSYKMDIYLKYITPKKPHQKDPSVDDNIPLLKFFLFIENEIDYYTILLKILCFLVEF